MRPGERMSLNAEGEAEWLRLKQHLEWSDDFALGFIFTRHPQVVALFRRRLSDIYRTRVTQLHIPIPESPAELINKLLPKLLSPAEHKKALKQPFWIDLSTRRERDWTKARLSFLIRLNEQRDPLRRALKSPLILILPQEERSHIKNLVPDLWAIRDFSLDTRMWLIDSPEPASRPSSEPGETFPMTDLDQSMIEEWEKLKDNNHKDQGFLLAAQRAYKACKRTGQYMLGRRIAESQVFFSRQILERTGNTSASQRDLSVSLDQLGEVSQALGEFEAARTLYEESLGIRRKIIGRVGETPESLRNLVVSLDNLGASLQELGDLTGAAKHFDQGLRIAGELSRIYPNLVDYKDLKAHFENRLERLTER